MWKAFRRGGKLSCANPLDTWTRNLLTPLAQFVGGRAVYPFEGPPYHPFQRWAQRADTVHSSFMGPLIHSDFGLWHAYRGAIILAERLVLPEPVSSSNPCDSCEARPCLSACPVGALNKGKYDTKKCVDHVSSAAGFDCRERGCLVAPAKWGRNFFTPPTKRDFTWLHFFEPRFRPVRPVSIPADAQAVMVRRRHALRQALPKACHGRAARCRRAGGNLRHGWNEK